MQKQQITSRKREEKSNKKFYFVRIREDSYKELEKLAVKEDRSTNSMVNLLLKQKLQELELS